MTDLDKIGHGANYDGYGINENGIDYSIDDLGSEFFEYDEERQPTDGEYIPGQFANEVAEELAFQEELAKETAKNKRRRKTSISSAISKNTAIQDIIPIEIEMKKSEETVETEAKKEVKQSEESEAKTTKELDTKVLNGPGHAYKYYQAKTKTYGLTHDALKARLLAEKSNMAYDIVWAWYTDGVIDHILSQDEIQKYTA